MIELTVYNPLRILWSTIMNRHRGSKEKPYKPQDLIKLSMDDGKDEDPKPQTTIKAAIERLGKKFKKNG